MLGFADLHGSPQYELAPPLAGALIESLRGVGYSAATALADLIDNSISAGARNVWLDFKFLGPDSVITVSDDGRGMSESELRRAMTLGGVGPLAQREAADLGRFGLGLKTASFSQCRCLTVVTKSAGVVSCRRWDLDYIARPDVGDWRLLPAPRPGSEGLFDALADHACGTVVIWEGLDRIVGAAAASDRAAESAFYEMGRRVEQHLAMVFHRYLEGPSPELRIHVGGHRVKPWDPFLRSNPATGATPMEPMRRANGMVEFQGFVLPHKDQLGSEYEEAGGLKGWTAQQGFYVYRNRRLLVAGGWLGLGSPRPWTTEEPYKLARISLEFSNTADSEWDIDVKKSVARPPRWLQPRLVDLAAKVRDDARRVFAHRGAYGKREAVPDFVPAWTSRQVSGATSYRVNRQHPAVTRALEAPSREAVEMALRIVEETVPVQRIWLDTVENGEAPREAFVDTPDPQVEALVRTMLRHLIDKIGLDRAHAMAQIRSTDPFQNFPAVIDRVAASEGA
ncbi:MAG: ATP-binding protein [Roseiarcus sp.]